MYFFWMTRWIHLNRRKGASIYSDLLPMTEVLKENGMTKYKIQIVQRWQSTKYRFYILASSAWNFDLNLHYWLSLLPDQSLDLNLSIYFYDVFMWLRWHPGWTEGGGLERLNSIYDFTPTQPQPNVMEGRRSRVENKGFIFGKTACYQDFSGLPPTSCIVACMAALYEFHKYHAS